jgi:hypothetical protein
MWPGSTDSTPNMTESVASSCNARPTAWLAVAFRPGLDRFPKLTYQRRIAHFTEELPFLSEEDKDWIMGRAVMRPLGWA